MSTTRTRTRLAALLTAGTVALALAGCGGDDKKSEPKEEGTAAAASRATPTPGRSPGSRWRAASRR